MTTFLDIIKDHPGLCRTVHVFCCKDCQKIMYSFARYKRAAYCEAKTFGWESFNQDTIWICNECDEKHRMIVNIEAGSISA